MQLRKSIGLGIMALAAVAYGFALDPAAEPAKADPILRTAKGMIERGRHAFRHDTLGSEERPCSRAGGWAGSTPI